MNCRTINLKLLRRIIRLKKRLPKYPKNAKIISREARRHPLWQASVEELKSRIYEAIKDAHDIDEKLAQRDQSIEIKKPAVKPKSISEPKKKRRSSNPKPVSNSISEKVTKTQSDWTLYASAKNWNKLKLLPKSPAKKKEALQKMLRDSKLATTVLDKINEVTGINPQDRSQCKFLKKMKSIGANNNNGRWHNCWIVRVGKYRIILRFYDEKKIVEALIRLRNKAYRESNRVK